MKQTSLKIKPETSIETSKNLHRNKICMLGLDMTHRQFANTPKDKFQDQNLLIQSMRNNRSTINDTTMITKTPKNNN